MPLLDARGYRQGAFRDVLGVPHARVRVFALARVVCAPAAWAGIVIPTQTCGQLRGHLQADADPKTAMDLYLGLE